MVGEGDGAVDGDGAAEGVGPADGAAEGEAVGEGGGAAEGETLGVVLGLGEGEGVGGGVGVGGAITTYVPGPKVWPGKTELVQLPLQALTRAGWVGVGWKPLASSTLIDVLPSTVPKVVLV
jgi:hypothetical protein